MSNYKLVCWEDIALPVHENDKWMAQDEDGTWWTYSKKPKRSVRTWEMPLKDFDSSVTIHNMCGSDTCELITPPEPGHWTEQLYWIY